jgi:hypothetical protein
MTLHNLRLVLSKQAVEDAHIYHPFRGVTASARTCYALYGMRYQISCA